MKLAILKVNCFKLDNYNMNLISTKIENLISKIPVYIFNLIAIRKICYKTKIY